MGIKFGLVCLMLSLGVEAVGQSATWDFESDSGNWRPRAATVKVERLTGVGATENSLACLHIHGGMQDNWNYALSDSVSMEAGRLYRLSAWVKVVSAGSETPMPFLKCEFVASDRRQEMGRAATTQYDATRLGQWQHLADELLRGDLYDHPWWRNTGRYCQYLSLPREAWTHKDYIVDLADCPRTHWYGPDHILRDLARRYRTG